MSNLLILLPNVPFFCSKKHECHGSSVLLCASSVGYFDDLYYSSLCYIFESTIDFLLRFYLCHLSCTNITDTASIRAIRFHNRPSILIVYLQIKRALLL